MKPCLSACCRIHLGLAFVWTLILCQCATYRGPMVADGSAGASSEAAPAPARLQERPGLGTRLGSEIRDGSTKTIFYRKPSLQPDAVATFHYNDKEGAKLMAELNGRARKHGGSFDLVPGKLSVSVLDSTWGYGDCFEHYKAGGKVFVIGKPGSGYSLRLENLTRQRLQVVVSVDGLDVLDGGPANVGKKGYVIAAKSAMTVLGMRVSGMLRAFQFASVAESRAATAFGEKAARNVGVIGVACYEEDEVARRRARVVEDYVRSKAQAF